MDRSKLSTTRSYLEVEDSLVSYGGHRRRTTAMMKMPANGIFYVASAHYDRDLDTDEDDEEDDDTTFQETPNNVAVSCLFAVDWERKKLLLADAEFDLEPHDDRPWLDVDAWLITGDGCDSLLLCRFHEDGIGSEKGVCFLTEAH